MPIYEFYCDQCHVILNFFSAKVNTETVPDCPRCGKKKLEKQISGFTTLTRRGEAEDDSIAGLDENKLEQAFGSLLQEAESMNTEDPRQMAALMRKFTAETGVKLGDSMDEAIARMEAGEDPELVEKEIGDLLNQDDFTLETAKTSKQKKQKPMQDDKLYDLK